MFLVFRLCTSVRQYRYTQIETQLYSPLYYSRENFSERITDGFLDLDVIFPFIIPIDEIGPKRDGIDSNDKN